MPANIALLTLPLLAASPLAGGTMPPRDPAYRLVWADEFNTPGPPDPQTWHFEEGFVRNHELQWYQKGNAACRDGFLVIEARREKVTASQRHPVSKSWRAQRRHANYTSSSLITRGPHQWTCGRFEIRAKIPTGPGIWPAIWTTGNGRWPHAGEIDIMEYYDHSILANVAWAGPRGGAKGDAAKVPLAKFGDESWGDSFHLWVMKWTPDKIELHLDGKLLNTTPLAKTINEVGEARSPFHAPQRLRLNLATGGTRGGDPSQTLFPARYLVDCVRVYQTARYPTR